MNKIKLIYDVVKAMKEKEVCQGLIKVEGQKDQSRVFNFTNEFEKNILNGQLKLKINTDLDYAGKKVKHESSTELQMSNCANHSWHGFGRHLHHRHAFLHHEGEQKQGCLKDKLAALLFILDTLNKTKVEEQEDKSLLVSLNIEEIPADLQEVLRKRMELKHPHEGDPGPNTKTRRCLMNEFCAMENPAITLNIWVSAKNEIQKAVLAVAGQQKDEAGQSHELSLRAELSLEA